MCNPSLPLLNRSLKKKFLIQLWLEKIIIYMGKRQRKHTTILMFVYGCNIIYNFYFLPSAFCAFQVLWQ